MKFIIIFILMALTSSFGVTVPDGTFHNPYTVISASLDGPQRVISLSLRMMEDVRIDKLVLTDPDGRVFTVNPERNTLAAGMQPTYEFIVESGQNFAMGKYRLLLVGQMTAYNQSFNHEVELEVK